MDEERKQGNFYYSYGNNLRNLFLLNVPYTTNNSMDSKTQYLLRNSKSQTFLSCEKNMVNLAICHIPTTFKHWIMPQCCDQFRFCLVKDLK